MYLSLQNAVSNLHESYTDGWLNVDDNIMYYIYSVFHISNHYRPGYILYLLYSIEFHIAEKGGVH